MANFPNFIRNSKGEDFRIIDLESGRAVEQDGTVLRKIALQLQLYGLMVKTIDPRAHVVLAVNDGTEYSVPFGPEILAQVREWLGARIDALPLGETISAEELAEVGPDCRWCGIRHRCESYLRKAPGLWSREIDWRLPLDTWGTVEQLTSKGNEFIDLTLRDAGGRRVKVFHLRKIRLPQIGVGKRIYMFDLAISRLGLRSSSRKHPLNFHEIDQDIATNRAWSLTIFVE